MTDDITQRLRAAVPKMPYNGTPIAWPCTVRSELLLEAAAEIDKHCRHIELLYDQVRRRADERDKAQIEAERLREALTDIANQETAGPYKWHLVVERLVEIAREALEGKP